MSVGSNLMKGLKPYMEKPVLANVLIGMASGFPLTLVVGVIGYWLADLGIDKKTIGIFALTALPWGLKFLWSPVLDRLSLGPLTQRFGQRRGWLGLIYVLMAVAIVALAFSRPDVDPVRTGFIALLIAFLSASHDVVIDAYRIEIMETHQYAHGATTYTLGYRIAYLGTGAGALFLADIIGWREVFLLLPIFLIPGFVVLAWMGEPINPDKEMLAEEAENIQRLGWFYESVVLPFKEFVSRSGWFMLLLFIFVFKIGDALVVYMTPPLLSDLGYSNTEIAQAAKLVGGFALWGGIIAGSFLYSILGLYRSLMVTILLMALTNVMFSWLALQDNDWNALALTMGFENFASSLGNVAVIAFLSGLCNRNFTATQYALLSAFATLGGRAIGATSGYMATAMDWAPFFVMTALISIPSFMLCIWLNKKGLLRLPDEKIKAATE